MADNTPSSKKPSMNPSFFEGMSREQRDEFHSADAQRERNEARKAEREEKKREGKVNDLSLGYTPSNNEEGISTATNDTFGNDEFSLADDDVVSSLNTLLLDYVKSDNTVAEATFYVE